MQRNDVKILRKEILHQGYCQVERYLLQNRLFSGDWSKPYLREVVRRFNAAAALLFDPYRDQVVMIEQFRIGALWQKNANPWLLELVAGVMDKEESPEELVRRETWEEAGMEVLELLPIYHYLSSPGGSAEEVNLFCAKVDASKAAKFSGLAHENEDIKVHVMDLRNVFSAVASGKINNAAAIIALQWLELNLTRIHAKWGSETI